MYYYAFVWNINTCRTDFVNTLGIVYNYNSNSLDCPRNATSWYFDTSVSVTSNQLTSPVVCSSGDIEAGSSISQTKPLESKVNDYNSLQQHLQQLQIPRPPTSMVDKKQHHDNNQSTEAGMVDSILDNFEDNFSAKRKGRRIWFRISGTDEEFETWNNQIHVWVNQEKVEYAHWQVETEPKYGLHIQGLLKFSKQIGPTTIASYFQGYANFDWGNLLNDQDYKKMKGYCTREQTRVRHGQTYGEDENESRAAKADIVRGLVDQIRSDGKIPARTLWFAQRKIC